MKKIKKFAMSLLGRGIAAAALAFTLMSAGVKDSKKTTQWHSVTYDALENKHRIGSPLGGNPSGDCIEAPSGVQMCAVEYDNSSNPTIEFVEDLPGTPNKAFTEEP